MRQEVVALLRLIEASIHIGKFIRGQDGVETRDGYYCETILHGSLTILHILPAEAAFVPAYFLNSIYIAKSLGR